MKHQKVIFLGLILISLLLVSGCSDIFDVGRPDDLEGLVATQVAQTMQAQHLVETIVAATLTAMPTEEQKAPEVVPPTEEAPTANPTDTATATEIPTDLPTAEPTATQPQTTAPTETTVPTQGAASVQTQLPTTAVTLRVSVPTNCRVGPGRPFEIVTVLDVGRTVNVVARHGSADFWVIENPAGSGTCWVWGEYATLTGPASSLPVQAAPPLATPQTPPGTVTLRVSVPTNCRVGPGRPFEIVTVLGVGRTVNVVARHGSADFWVIENPAGSGTCWVWGEYATLTGPASSLPVQAAPPLATPQATPQVTPGAVTLRVRVPTNCRVGPGRPFEIVSVLGVGTTARVVARHGSADFWVIENPAGSGTCWVWGEYATLTGPASSLPVQAAPPLATPQATPGVVTLRVSVPTNCRVGPGRPFEIVTVLGVGRTVNVVARHGSADFWVIENPAGAGTCWVWGEYATLTGPASSLPVQAAPPLATPLATPAAVSLTVSVDTNCRTRPGKPNPIVTIFRIGMTGEVLARNAAGTFWAIRNPIGAGHCWVWGKYATLTGPTGNLPIW